MITCKARRGTLALRTVMVLAMLSATCRALTIEGFTPDEVLTYKTTDKGDLKFHAFFPPDAKRSAHMPAIVFFHGGGWSSGSPSQFYPHCKYFASRGMVAMSAEYRLTRGGTTPRECVKDGKSAIRWIRTHASELAIDPNAVVAGGGSAGGHIAAATATVTAFDDAENDLSVSCVPNALILFNPVFDNGPEGGWGYGRVKEYWRDISPAHNINEKTPATVVFLGTADRLIPVATAKRYQRIMRDLDQRCDLHLYEGQGHGFFNYTNPEYYRKTVGAADDFLVSLDLLGEREEGADSDLGNSGVSEDVTK